MATFTEGQHAGGFLTWEVLRDYTRDTVTLALGAGKLAPGRTTSGGKYTVLTPGDSNGSQNAAGILWGAVDATRREDDITGFGDARIWSETTRIDLRVAEVANPRPGDRIEIDGEAFLIQGEPVRDRERLVWTVDLRPA